MTRTPPHIYIVTNANHQHCSMNQLLISDSNSNVVNALSLVVFLEYLYLQVSTIINLHLSVRNHINIKTYTYKFKYTLQRNYKYT